MSDTTRSCWTASPLVREIAHINHALCRGSATTVQGLGMRILLCLSERVVQFQSSVVELFFMSAPARRHKTIAMGRFAKPWTINTNSRNAEIWTHGIRHGAWRDHRRKHGSST
jgi:hypothetical protein